MPPIFPVSGVGFFLVVQSNSSVCAAFAGSSVDGRLGWARILATVKTAATNDDAQAWAAATCICEHLFLALGFLSQFSAAWWGIYTLNTAQLQ